MGERIAQERREMSVRLRRDITRAEVAQAVGVDAAAVTRWESGEVVPRDDALIRLAQFFGVTRGWLRWGELPREAPPPEVLPNSSATPASEIPEHPAQQHARTRRNGSRGRG